MKRIGMVFMLSVSTLAILAAVAHADKRIKILDACDPTTFDDTFGPGTCMDVGGDVTVEEFLSDNVLPEGHPAWANEPGYIRIKPGKRVNVINKGGEVHTFTEVVAFGGGFIPDLNNPTGSAGVPECVEDGGANPALVFISPGGKLELTELSIGTHFFECCIHPWMRAAIKVVGEQTDEQ